MVLKAESDPSFRGFPCISVANAIGSFSLWSFTQSGLTQSRRIAQEYRFSVLE